MSYVRLLDCGPQAAPQDGPRAEGSLDLSGGVFAAEEGLIEVVDAVVERGNVGAHFLAERGDIGAHFLAEGNQHAEQGNTGADDRNDDLCCVAHADSLAHAGFWRGPLAEQFRTAPSPHFSPEVGSIGSRNLVKYSYPRS